MVDIDELRALQSKAGGVKVRLIAYGHNEQYLTHEEVAAFEFAVNSAIQMPATLDELATLRAAVVPKMMCDDQVLADAVRAAARALNPHGTDMELELAAQHIEAGRITTCDPFFYQIDNERLEAENKALRAADKWLDIDPDGADIVGIKRCHLNYLVALADYCAGEGVCGPNPEMEPDEWCAAAWERYGPQGGDYSSDGLAATLATHYRPLPAPPQEI